MSECYVDLLKLRKSTFNANYFQKPKRWPKKTPNKRRDLLLCSNPAVSAAMYRPNGSSASCVKMNWFWDNYHLSCEIHTNKLQHWASKLNAYINLSNSDAVIWLKPLPLVCQQLDCRRVVDDKRKPLQSPVESIDIYIHFNSRLSMVESHGGTNEHQSRRH